MTIWYIDPENGSSGGAGTSFATRNNALGNITPSAGDEVRFIGSPDPTDMGMSATWTNKSLTVTLASSVTQNIYLDGAWTASANVTATTDTTNKKEGSNASSLAIAAGFTTGKVAYYATGTLDLSGYYQVSFWIRANAAVAANVFRLRLSADATGDTATNEFVINRALNSGQYTVLTFNNGSALSSSIQSVALIADSDPGTVTVLIDDIIACKDPSLPDSLNLQSLIGKNTGYEGWYAVKSINGASVVVDAYNNSMQGNGRGYSGTTESATIYKRETIKTPAVATSTTLVESLGSAGGTSGSPITISGGWNRTDMSTQALQSSIMDGLDGFGHVFSANTSNQYITVNKIGGYHYTKVVFLQSSTNTRNWIIDNIYSGCSSTNSVIDSSGGSDGPINFWQIAINGPWIQTGCQVSGFGLRSLNQCQVGDLYSYSSGSNGFSFNSFSHNIIIRSITALNNSLSGVDSSNTDGLIVGTFVSKDNGNYAIYNRAPNTVVYNMTSSGNSAGVFNTISQSDPAGPLYVYNGNFAESNKLTSTAFLNARVFSQSEGGVPTANVLYADGGTVRSDTTTYPTGQTQSWRFNPTSTNRDAAYPLSFPLSQQIACKANKTVTISVQARRDNTGLIMNLRIPGGIYPGVGTFTPDGSGDIVTSVDPSINTWTTYTISATPTQDCVITIYGEAYGGTTYNGYFAGPVLISGSGIAYQDLTGMTLVSEGTPFTANTLAQRSSVFMQ